MAESKLTRIGIFYDGNFFSVVSNYYTYFHSRKSRINISKLHEFVKNRVAKEEHADPKFCQIVDVHYFRGRFSATESDSKGMLLRERLFEDVLIREGVTTHFLPMSPSREEKGIDVWLALEAYELAMFRRFDVCVLIASDSDYVPLARKLNALGIRVMVLGWDFEYSDHNGEPRTTKTSVALLDEVSYPINMSNIIEDKTLRMEIDPLFLPRPMSIAPYEGPRSSPSLPPSEGGEDRGPLSLPVPSLRGRRLFGLVQNVLDGFGFLTPEEGGTNLFFHASDLEGLELMELQRGQRVSFELGSNSRGSCARKVRRVEEEVVPESEE